MLTTLRNVMFCAQFTYFLRSACEALIEKRMYIIYANCGYPHLSSILYQEQGSSARKYECLCEEVLYVCQFTVPGLTFYLLQPTNVIFISKAKFVFFLAIGSFRTFFERAHVAFILHRCTYINIKMFVYFILNKTASPRQYCNIFKMNLHNTVFAVRFFFLQINIGTYLYLLQTYIWHSIFCVSCFYKIITFYDKTVCLKKNTCLEF